MIIRDIFSLAGQYLKLGLAAVIFFAILFLAFYFLYYRKKDKRLPFRQLALYSIFICYIVVVLGVTVMRSSGVWQGNKIMPLFYSYREAWSTFSAVDWRNIILNILMFVPFGFLLPFLTTKFQKFWNTYLAGFLFTLAIEVIQLFFKLGIFECDDLMNNLAGAMIGYGCYKIVQFIILKVKKKKAKLLPVLCSQIPALVVLAGFATIFGLYNMKELGNLSNNYIYKLKNVEASSDVKFSTEEKSAMVYQLHVASKDETKQLAEKIFGNLGLEIDESRTILYDDTAIYYSTSDENTGTKSLWIDYLGSTFSYTDFDTFAEAVEAEIERNTEAEETEIREVLKSMGIDVPKEAVFAYDEKNENYRFSANGDAEGRKLYQGDVTCEYGVNGKILDMNYYMFEYEEYKEFPIISEQEAFEKIAAGMFCYAQADSYEVLIEKVCLEYQIDSKGFYQPVYAFEGKVNGEDTVIIIPAIE